VNSNGFQPVAIHHNDQFGDKTHAREAFDPYPPEAFISTTLVHNVLGYYRNAPRSGILRALVHNVLGYYTQGAT